MSFLSEGKDEYLDKLNPRDLLDLIWFPFYIIAFLFIQTNISKHNPTMADKLDALLFGVIHIFSARSLSILYSMRWLASLFSRKPLVFATPTRLRVLGGIISLIALVLLFKGQR